jgi:hypothetical protein
MLGGQYRTCLESITKRQRYLFAGLRQIMAIPIFALKNVILLRVID